MNKNQKKILILNPNIPPRAIKFLNLLVKESVFDYNVFFYSVSSKNRRWNIDKKAIKFKYKILKSFEIGFGIKDYFPFIISLDFIYELLKLKPDVIVVPGWADMPSYISTIYCLFTGCKLILRSESTKYEKSFRRTLFAPITKFVIRTASSFIASGTQARKYLISLGATPKKIFVGYSPIDVEYFQKRAFLSLSKRNAIRRKMGVPKTAKIILFVGQLIVRKGIYDLIDSFASIATSEPNAFLVFIGYGPELGNLKDLVSKLNIQNRVIFINFVPNEELPRYYTASDIFVLPSYEETWGIVVNEAMACGLPVVVNEHVGSSHDLVRDGISGIVFKSGKTEELTRGLRILLDNGVLRQKFSKNAKQIIRSFDLENLKAAMIKAIVYVLSDN